MLNSIIKVENLSKQYQLGQVGTGTLTRDLQRWYSRIRGKEDPTLKIGQENILSSHRSPNTGHRIPEFVWALKDINFEVKQGEVLGIIGKNGAGKSTLLKILSQVTSPTTGEIKVRGRIASLLEVGTGFHPELTGRENIFLNGAILGMTKAEIRGKFDEIVDFSGVEKYIDTPVKRYSSGMYVRLAFAVAAHLEPEILVVDEVLAVGDLIFQRKCIDKMINISKEGRTILFVSHNLSAVKSLCSTGILIENGKILRQKDNIDSIIESYTKGGLNFQTENELDLLKINRQNPITELGFSRIWFEKFPIKFGDDIKFSLTLKSFTKKTFYEIELGAAVNDKLQNCLIHVGNRFINKEITHNSDNSVYTFNIENNLKPGYYSITLFLRSKDRILDWLINVITIEIADGNPYGYLDINQLQGAFLPDFTVTVSENKYEEKD